MKTKFRNYQTKLYNRTTQSIKTYKDKQGKHCYWVITLDGLPAFKHAAYLFKFLKDTEMLYRIINKTTGKVHVGNFTVCNYKLIHNDDTGEVVAQESDVLHVMLYRQDYTRLIPTSR